MIENIHVCIYVCLRRTLFRIRYRREQLISEVTFVADRLYVEHTRSYIQVIFLQPIFYSSLAYDFDTSRFVSRH